MLRISNNMNKYVMKHPGYATYLMSKYKWDTNEIIHPGIAGIELLGYYKNGVYMFNLTMEFADEYLNNIKSMENDINYIYNGDIIIRPIYANNLVTLNRPLILSKVIGLFSSNGIIYNINDVHHIIFHRNPELVGATNTVHMYIIDGKLMTDMITNGDALKTINLYNMTGLSELCTVIEKKLLNHIMHNIFSSNKILKYLF